MGNTAASYGRRVDRPQEMGYRAPAQPASSGQGDCSGLQKVSLVALVALAILAVIAVMVVRVLPKGGGSSTCSMEPLPDMWTYAPAGPEMQVKILSFNLFWWQLFGIQKAANGAPFKLIQNSDKPMPYDFMGFQECEDGFTVLRGAQLLDQYTLYPGMGTTTTAICMAFLTRNWEHLAHGCTIISEDSPSQHFGMRGAQWMRVRHRSTGRTVFFMNHHGPTPVNSGGVCGGAVLANKLLSLIHTNAMSGDAVVLVGDFNAVQGTPTIQGLSQQLQRVFGGSVDGGIDHIFANAGATQVVGERNLGSGGSDHDALALVLRL